MTSRMTAVALVEALRDRYALERELGAGGMATVWLARDLKHDRPVALKVLRPELSAMLGAERFLREVQLTARLQHPHILTLIDSGEAAGLLYYVMPYVEGESLRARLQREGQLPLGDAVAIARSVAAALDYAHAQGVIHRDIKPENILLHQGEAVVADFGIALAVSSAGRERLTETGLSLGTPAYMSPEQATATSRLDGRTDQYSLACVVYEMLAGEPPYTGATAQAIIAKRLSEPVPHLSTLRAVPPAVDQAITRALARAPADRFETTVGFADRLAAPEPASLLGKHRARIRPAVLTAGGGFLVAALAMVTVLNVPWRRTSRPAVPTQRQFTYTARASEPALAPDGRSIAYVSGGRSLVLERLAGGGPTVLVRSGGWIAWPRWSPDGGWLYFTMLSEGAGSAAIHRVQARGGAPTRIIEAMGPVDFSPDGRTLVRAAGDMLILHDPVTGQVRGRLPASPFPIADTSTAERMIWPTDVAWSPDGRWIASVNDSGWVTVTSAAGEHRTRLLAQDRLTPVRWSTGSGHLFYRTRVGSGSDLMRLAIDRRTGARRGEELVSLSGLPFNRTTETDFDLARSGHTVAFVKGPESQHLWAFRLEPGRDTAAGLRLSRNSRAYDWPAVTRDGRMVAVMQHDEDLALQGNYFVVPMDGGDFTRLTDGPGYKFNPAWAPEGKRFAYIHHDSSGSRLVLTDRSGQRLYLGTTEPSRVGYFRIAWAANAETLLYPAGRNRKLVALDVANGAEVITPGLDSMMELVAGVLSPDGRQVIAAELHRPEEGFRIWRGTVGRAIWTRLPAPPGDNVPLIWREDGWIYLFTDQHGDNRVFRSSEHPAIWRMRPDGSRQERVAWLPAKCRLGFVSMSGDARRLACAVLDREPDIWLVSNLGEDG